MNCVGGIDEQFAARDAGQPALIDDLDVEPMLLEMMEQLQRIARLGEHIDVLRRAVDAGIARESVGPGDEEGDPGLRHQL